MGQYKEILLILEKGKVSKMLKYIVYCLTGVLDLVVVKVVIYTG
jgi:hypothetical protein